MTEAVLDASALLAMLRKEPGRERVSAIINDAAVSVVNLSEVVDYFAQNGLVESEIRRLLDPLPFVRVAFDEGIAYAAGLLRPLTRPAGLSFADRACLALAKKLGVPALTTDQAWSRIAAAVGVEVELIR